MPVNILVIVMATLLSNTFGCRSTSGESDVSDTRSARNIDGNNWTSSLYWVVGKIENDDLALCRQDCSATPKKLSPGDAVEERRKLCTGDTAARPVDQADYKAPEYGKALMTITNLMNRPLLLQMNEENARKVELFLSKGEADLSIPPAQRAVLTDGFTDTADYAAEAREKWQNRVINAKAACNFQLANERRGVKTIRDDDIQNGDSEEGPLR